MPTSYHTPGVYVEETSSGLAPIVGVGTSTAGFIGVIKLATADTTNPPVKNDDSQFIAAEDKYSFKLSNQKEDGQPKVFNSVKFGEVKLCTNFTEFRNFFGDFSANPGQNLLVHAVYGFFRNGGTRCFVTWVKEEIGIEAALDKFEAIDEIALVLAPGVTDKEFHAQIDAHCRNLSDRFAILDTYEDIALENLVPGEDKVLGNSDYAALYHPWIQVFDPVTNGLKFVPPSGHIAGIYARVDDKRGVHKAPANEPILGAVGLREDISKRKQGPLNDLGINCIRNLNGNIRIWGARTLGAGKDNPDFKYINIRRQFNYLRESIDEGTQWVVFEPNSPELWARIRRNVGAFLTNEWRKGALFGTTPQEAFFVKCDAENNPINSRKLGQVVAEIGVAVIEPAEFVIFRISQIVDEKTK